MKNDKILLIMIILIIIAIIIIIGVIYFINRNRSIKENKDDVFDRQEGGAEYSTSELNNFELEITNLNSNIKNKNQLTLKVKEYVYLNGLVQANQAECISSKEQESRIVLTLKLNDPKQTILTVVINLKDNTYQISEE